jgi:hypothetical protein
MLYSSHCTFFIRLAGIGIELSFNSPTNRGGGVSTYQSLFQHPPKEAIASSIFCLEQETKFQVISTLWQVPPKIATHALSLLSDTILPSNNLPLLTLYNCQNAASWNEEWRKAFYRYHDGEPYASGAPLRPDQLKFQPHNDVTESEIRDRASRTLSPGRVTSCELYARA